MMTNIRRKDWPGCEPCGGSAWKLIVRELWERYQSVVRSITVDNRRYHPDGDGNVDLGDIGTIKIYDIGGTYYEIECTIMEEP